MNGKNAVGLSMTATTIFTRASQWLRMMKTKLLVVFLWSFTGASLIVKSYWLLYIQNPVLIEHVMVFTHVGKWVPRLFWTDYIIIIIASLVAGAVLVDLKDVLFSWIASIFLILISSTLYMFLFVWFSLGAGAHFASLGVANIMVSWVLFYVMVNVFWMYFPVVLFFSLLISLIGSFLRSRFSPSM